MFQYFRINDPYRLIAVFILAFIIRIIYFFLDLPITTVELKWLLLGERLGDGFSMYRDAYDYTGPLSAAVYGLLDIVFGRSIVMHQLLATLLLATNASIFNIMLIRNRAYEENNYLPALFFVLLGFVIPDFVSLSPQLMASFFIILTLNNVFRRINNQVEDNLFLNSGIYLGLAGLFYFPAILFVLLFLIALLLFSSAILRRIVLYLYGFSIPFILVFGYYFWYDSGIFFVRMILTGITGEAVRYIEFQGFWIIAGFMGFWLLLGFYGSFFLSRQNNYEFRILQVMLLFVVTSTGIIFLDRELSVTQFVFFLPPISYFLTYYAISIKKRFWKIVMPGCIVIGLISGPFVFRNYFSSFLKTIDTTVKPIGEKERLMLCGDELSYYLHHKIASPFIDPYISKRQDDRLDFYGQAEDVFFSISGNYPDIIKDDWNIMDQYFEVFPEIKNNYRKEDSVYVRITD